ncbi:hypothetical protein NKH77_23345 [Streptomyces sp. M19]
MLMLEVRRGAQKRLGVEPKIGDWCELGAIPEPPQDVHAEAGGGRLRPATMPVLGMVGTGSLSFPDVVPAAGLFGPGHGQCGSDAG